MVKTSKCMAQARTEIQGRPTLCRRPFRWFRSWPPPSLMKRLKSPCDWG